MDNNKDPYTSLSADLLAQIIESAPILISVKDTEGRVVLANKQFEVLDLPDRSLWLGKTLHDIYSAKDAENYWEQDLKTQQSGEPFSCNELLRHKDGTERLYQTLKFAIYDANGKIIGSCALSRDISAEQHIAYVESHYKRILNILSEGVITIHRSGKVTFINEAAAQAFDCDGAMGSSIEARHWYLRDEDGQQLHYTQYPAYQCFKQNKPVFNHVVDAVKGTHQSNWLLVNSHPFEYDAAGNVESVVSSLVDINILKDIENDLALYQGLFERSSEGIIIYNAGRRIIKVNLAFQQLTGFSASEVIGKGPEIFRVKGTNEAINQEIEDALHTRGYWQGEVERQRKNGVFFTAWLTTNVVTNSHNEVSHYISIFSDISALKQHQRDLNFLAHHDPLTGLPNRTLLMDRVLQALTKAERFGRKYALLFIDLDRFKEVNDTAGHSVGDAILIETARRMTECVRQSDTLARLGGDEFMLLMEEISSKDEVITVAERIREYTQAPYAHAGKEFYLSCSIGISLLPDDGTTVDDLIAHADSAMYQAKAQGRNTWSWFNKQQHDTASEKVDLERALHKALPNQELRLMYQPQIDLLTNKIVGAEALLRWNHPEKGWIPPLKFIPIAERCGLIIPIGEWVIAEACDQLARWDAIGLHVPVMAVNVSAKQVPSANFIGRVKEHLRRNQLSSQRLELELTESVLMQIDNVQHTIEAIRAEGIHLAIDDFGTGFSSLTYLRELPIQRLKVDRGFIQQIPGNRGDESIIRAVIGLAHNLNIDVIAEGVETEMQKEFLLQNHCYSVQGFYYAKPMFAEDFAAYMKEKNASADHAESELSAKDEQ